MIASAETVLPEPDSPTTPSDWRSAIANETPRTTRLKPPGTGRSTLSFSTSTSITARAQLRVERVAQAVAEQVEAEHGEGDREPRKHCEPRRQIEPGLRVRQHPSPRDQRRLGAEAEIGERGFGEDGDGELDRRLHDQRRRRCWAARARWRWRTARAQRRARRARIRAKARRSPPCASAWRTPARWRARWRRSH